MTSDSEKRDLLVSDDDSSNSHSHEITVVIRQYHSSRDGRHSVPVPKLGKALGSDGYPYRARSRQETDMRICLAPVFKVVSQSFDTRPAS